MDTHGRWSAALLESDTLCHGRKALVPIANSAINSEQSTGSSNHFNVCVVLNLYMHVGHTLVGPCLNFEHRVNWPLQEQLHSILAGVRSGGVSLMENGKGII